MCLGLKTMMTKQIFGFTGGKQFQRHGDNKNVYLIFENLKIEC